VLSKPITCGVAETYHDAVLPKPITAVLPKPITCGAAETYNYAVLPKRTRLLPEGGIYVRTFLTTERLVPSDRHHHI
jgi:hypothetical protein